MSESVTLAIDGGVARIGLNRAVLDMDVARTLRDAVAEVAATSDVGAMVLHAVGEVFCVGGDLNASARAERPGEFIAELAGTMHDAILALRELHVPVISVVQGACAGGGIGLALAADLVLAERTARFRVAYTAVGLSSDCGVSWALTDAIGPARANDLILTNRPVDAVEAERLGLVSRVVEPGTGYGAALQLAQTLAAGPRHALARSAALVRAASTTPLAEHLRAEATSIAELIDTPDGAEGVAAFLDKRPAHFGQRHDSFPAT